MPVSPSSAPPIPARSPASVLIQRMLTVGLVALGMGGGCGWVLRQQPQALPRVPLLQREQSFPPQAWPGETLETLQNSDQPLWFDSPSSGSSAAGSPEPDPSLPYQEDPVLWERPPVDYSPEWNRPADEAFSPEQESGDSALEDPNLAPAEFSDPAPLGDDLGDPFANPENQPPEGDAIWDPAPPVDDPGATEVDLPAGEDPVDAAPPEPVSQEPPGSESSSQGG